MNRTRDFITSFFLALNTTAMFSVAAGIEAQNGWDYCVRTGLILTGVFSCYIGAAFFKRALDA